MSKNLSLFLEEMKKKKKETEDTLPTVSGNAMDAPTPMHIMNPTNTSSSINGDTNSDKRPSLFYKKKTGDQYDLTGNSRRRKLYVHRIDEEKFINGREYASHGLMHPEHAKMALHQKTGNTIDFYAHGTGDKISGKVTKNDGKNVHIKDTSGKIHQFKVTPHLPKKTNEEFELDEGRGRKSAAAKASGEEGDAGDTNIIYQMRKSINLRGLHNVKFADGSSMKVHPSHAHRVISHFNTMKRPIDKQAFTNKIGASSSAFKKHLQGEDVGGIDGETAAIYNPRSNWGDTVKTSGLTRESFNESFASFVEAMGHRDAVVTMPPFSQAFMPTNPTDPVGQPTSHAIPTSSMTAEDDELPDERDNGASVVFKRAIRSLLKHEEEIVDPVERERLRTMHRKRREDLFAQRQRKLDLARSTIMGAHKRQREAERVAHLRRVKQYENFDSAFGEFIAEAGFPSRGKQDSDVEGDRMGVSVKSPDKMNRNKEKTVVKGNSKQDQITLNPPLRMEATDPGDIKRTKVKHHKKVDYEKANAKIVQLSKIIKEDDYEPHSAPIPWETDESHDVGKSEKLYQKVRNVLSGKPVLGENVYKKLGFGVGVGMAQNAAFARSIASANRQSVPKSMTSPKKDDEKKVKKKEAEQVDEISIGKMVQYSTAARKQMLQHSRIFKGSKATPEDDKIIAKRAKGDKLAGKKLERKYKQMDESFVAGIDDAPTATELGIRAHGGFAHHSSITEEAKKQCSFCEEQFTAEEMLKHIAKKHLKD